MLGRGRERTYKGAVSEQLDAVLLAYICHAVERPCVNQRELYMKKTSEINYFFFQSSVRPSEEGGGGDTEIWRNQDHTWT
jgi:hypothetical protein